MISRKIKYRIERSIRKKLLRKVERKLQGSQVIMTGDEVLSPQMKEMVLQAARGRSAIITHFNIANGPGSLPTLEDVTLAILDGDKVVDRVYLHVEIPDVRFLRPG
jgi:hypothetical protein